MSFLRTAAVAAAAALALGATIASGEENEAKKVDGGPASAQTADFAVGDTVELGDWQVKVNQVTDPYLPGNEFISPSPGERYVRVDAQVTNRSDSPQTVSSVMCFSLRDNDNRSHDITITDGGSTIDGEVPAGGTLRGDLDFEIPEQATDLQLQFKCDLFGSGSALIDLS
ncbi:DUF4352 domain-containing protein [Gordonia sp. VNK21]|uniref:DUF4352 domain-containing protein n=1 Tax=Gordonia sp. VNK21 TaxID=3382483 RepID=UPI0038D36004